MPLITDLDTIRTRLFAAKTVAVLGAHDDTKRPAYYVPEYLSRHGYRVIPVNAVKAGQTLWGESVLASLRDIKEPIDILDVFRAPEALMGHLDEILALKPALVWLQVGIVSQPFREAIVKAGIELVEDRCMYADHRLWKGRYA